MEDSGSEEIEVCSGVLMPSTGFTAFCFPAFASPASASPASAFPASAEAPAPVRVAVSEPFLPMSLSSAHPSPCRPLNFLRVLILPEAGEWLKRLMPLRRQAP